MYGSGHCKNPCFKRYLYGNKMNLIGESWIIDFDTNGHVIEADYILSP